VIGIVEGLNPTLIRLKLGSYDRNPVQPKTPKGPKDAKAPKEAKAPKGTEAPAPAGKAGTAPQPAAAGS
jgi:hypothetical protein